MDFIRRHLALILQLILTVILVGAVVFRVFSSDRNGPEIVLPDSDIVLTDSTTDAQLFEGLTASDDADGDVSDSLKLESVTKVSDNLVLLVYAAKDKSNNVSTVTRALMTNGTFTYKGMIEAVGEPAAPGSAESDISYPPESGLAASSETMIPGESSIPSGTETSLAVVPDTGSFLIRNRFLIPNRFRRMNPRLLILLRRSRSRRRQRAWISTRVQLISMIPR